MNDHKYDPNFMTSVSSWCLSMVVFNIICTDTTPGVSKKVYRLNQA